MPDLRVLAPGRLRRLDQGRIGRIGLRARFDAREEHRVHDAKTRRWGEGAVNPTGLRGWCDPHNIAPCLTTSKCRRPPPRFPPPPRRPPFPRPPPLREYPT